MMDCTEFREHLEEYAGGAVGGPLKERLQEHLATCHECHALLSSWLLLEEEIAAEKVRQPNPFAATRILQRLEQESVRRSWWEMSVLRPVFATVMLIAALALGFFLGSQGSNEPIAEEQNSGDVQMLREQLFISDLLHEDLNELSNNQ